jgi:hypothetical protein
MEDTSEIAGKRIERDQVTSEILSERWSVRLKQRRKNELLKIEHETCRKIDGVMLPYARGPQDVGLAGRAMGSRRVWVK